MSSGLEQLKRYTVEEIAAKTHIRNDVIKAIFEKRFDKIHSVKARGFVTILEREYGVDLSDWLEEYTAYIRSKTAVDINDQGGYFIAPGAEEKNLRKKVALVTVGIGVVVLAMLFFRSSDEVSTPSESPQSVVASAFETHESNESKESNVTIVPVDVNLAVIKTDINTSATGATAAVTDKNGTGLQTIPGKIVLQSSRKLWFLIKYPDGRKEEHMIQQRYEINEVQGVVFLFGHGGVTLATPTASITIPISPSSEMVEYKDGRFTHLAQEAKPKTETAPLPAPAAP